MRNNVNDNYYKKYKKYKNLYKLSTNNQDAGTLSKLVRQKAQKSRERLRTEPTRDLDTLPPTKLRASPKKTQSPVKTDTPMLTYFDLIPLLETINESPLYKLGSLSDRNNRMHITFKSYSVKINSTWENIVNSTDATINNNPIHQDRHLKTTLLNLISEDDWQNLILSNVILLADIIKENDVLDTLNREAFSKDNIKLWNGTKCVYMPPSQIKQQNEMISAWLQGNLCTTIELEIGYDAGAVKPSGNPWHTDGTCRFFINYPKDVDNPELTKEDYGLTQYINHPEVPDNLIELIETARNDDLPDVYYNTHNKGNKKRLETLSFLQHITQDPENVKDTDIEKWEFHWPDLFMRDRRGNIIHIPGRWHQKNPSRATTCSIKRVYARIDFPMLNIGNSDNNSYHRLLEHSGEVLQDSETWNKEYHEGDRIHLRNKRKPNINKPPKPFDINRLQLPPHLLAKLRQ